jgi:hypothetical protein
VAIRALAVVVVALAAAGCSFAPQQASGTATIDGASAGGGGVDARVHEDAKLHDAPGSIDAAPDAAAGPALTLTTTTLGNGNVDLTSEGTVDWAHWGLDNTNSFDDKATGGTAISNLAASPAGSFGGSPFTASWSDGTPHMDESQTSSGVLENQGSTMTITAPADTTLRTLRVYVGVQGSSAQLDVSLSDDSATAATATLTSDQTLNVCYEIVYRAASSGQTVTVSWKDTHDQGGGGSFTTLLSATLQ